MSKLALWLQKVIRNVSVKRTSSWSNWFEYNNFTQLYGWGQYNSLKRKIQQIGGKVKRNWNVNRRTVKVEMNTMGIAFRVRWLKTALLVKPNCLIVTLYYCHTNEVNLVLHDWCYNVIILRVLFYHFMYEDVYFHIKRSNIIFRKWLH